jgi:hypothetical protein
MERTVLITLNEDNVASRFDLATEVLLTTVGPDGRIGVHTDHCAAPRLGRGPLPPDPDGEGGGRGLRGHRGRVSTSI